MASRPARCGVAARGATDSRRASADLRGHPTTPPSPRGTPPAPMLRGTGPTARSTVTCRLRARRPQRCSSSSARSMSTRSAPVRPRATHPARRGARARARRPPTAPHPLRVDSFELYRPADIRPERVKTCGRACRPAPRAGRRRFELALSRRRTGPMSRRRPSRRIHGRRAACARAASASRRCDSEARTCRLSGLLNGGASVAPPTPGIVRPRRALSERLGGPGSPARSDVSREVDDHRRVVGGALVPGRARRGR